MPSGPIRRLPTYCWLIYLLASESAVLARMLRTGRSRAALRLLSNSSQPSSVTITSALNRPQLRSKLCTLSSRRPQAVPIVSNSLATAFRRGASTQPPWNKPDIKAEKELGQQKLEPHPKSVSTTSTVHPIWSEHGQNNARQEDPNFTAGLKADVVC